MKLVATSQSAMMPDVIAQWHDRSLKHLAVVKIRRMLDDTASLLVREGVLSEEQAVDIVQSIASNGLDAWLALHPQLLKRYPEDDAESQFLSAAATSLARCLSPFYSEEFVQAWKSLITGIPGLTSYEDLMTEAERLFSYKEQGKEEYVVQMTLSLMRQSMEYWRSQGVQKLKPSTWVIINDTIGGVLGTVFGPFGSILLAGAASAYTNEQI